MFHQADQFDSFDDMWLSIEHDFKLIAQINGAHPAVSEAAALDEFFNVNGVHLLNRSPRWLRMSAQILSFRRQRNCITEHNGNDRDRSHPMAQTPPMTNSCDGFY